QRGHAMQYRIFLVGILSLFVHSSVIGAAADAPKKKKKSRACTAVGRVQSRDPHSMYQPWAAKFLFFGNRVAKPAGKAAGVVLSNAYEVGPDVQDKQVWVHVWDAAPTEDPNPTLINVGSGTTVAQLRAAAPVLLARDLFAAKIQLTATEHAAMQAFNP